jgi:hypothetical protein
LKGIPEVPIDVPDTAGKGAHVEMIVVRRQGFAGRRKASQTKNYLLGLLPVLAAELMPASSTEQAERSDTMYAQQPVQRIRRTITSVKDGWGFLAMEIPSNTFNKQTLSDIKGSSLQYIAPDGTLLNAHLERSYSTSTPIAIDQDGQILAIKGTASDTVTITRLPGSR